MTLPKELTTVTRLSKTMALILFITLPIFAFFFGIKYQEVVDLPKQQNIVTNSKSCLLPRPAALNTIIEKELCDFIIKLPDGYHIQEPTNSFFGNTETKANKGQICKVILGPHYKMSHEGFLGEQIQINVYPTVFTDITELVKQEQDTKTDDYLPIHAYKFTRSSYGGEDEVLLFENNFRIYQIIWRNEPNNLEGVVRQIINQL